jgi:NADPH2:quinone reductase
MKAIHVERAGGPDVLTLKDVPDPVAGAGQVVVNVKAAGINPFEVYMREGWYPSARFPFIPGVDGAGIVDSVGAGVTRVKPGDRVWFAAAVGGSYAEKALVNEATVRPLPEQFAFAQGAALGVPYGTAHFGLFQRGGAKAGETVLIHGASGGVGLAGVEWASAAGLTVIGTASTDRGRALAKEHGAHHVFDHGKTNYLDQIREATGGQGVDLVLEMAAHVNLGKDLTILKKFGRVVAIGSRGTVEIDPRITLGNQLSILGMSLNNATPEEMARIHGDIDQGLENGTLNPVVGREFTLADTPAAQTAVMESGAYGKIVVVP